MKTIIHTIELSLLIIMIAFSFSINIFAQEDNPLIDQVPREWLESINYSHSEEDVITDNDGYDNFNLGVDFAEPHLSQNPLNPLQFFGAYNINNAWRTTNGHDWISSTPGFGTSVNGDPCTAYDGAGNLYYESMFGGITGCKVIKSTDNGASWFPAVTAISGGDKNWMACDQTSGPYSGYIYTSMTNTGFTGHNFARSTDGGATFTQTFSHSNSPLPGAMVCVGPNGTTDGGAVYFVTNSGNSFNATYTFFRSTNGGLNFSQMSAVNFANYVGTNVGGRNSVQNMRTRPYPFIAADNSNGTYRGRLYCVYASNTPAGDGNKPDIFCRYTTDQGATWSSAVKINDDVSSQNNHQWHPSIWCDRSSGRLFVKWMDTRDTPTSDSAYIYASYSDNGGVTWVSNKRISNQKMKIDCSTCGGGGTPRYQGDYDAIVSSNNQALLMWSDFRYGNFGSYVGYFPDFAMKVPPSMTTIENNSDSAFIIIDVPGVKLYNSTAIFSSTILPTPPSGTIILDFPEGNTLSTFPGSVILRVRTSGNVTLGNYTINIKGEGPNGTPVHRRTVSLEVVLPTLDFSAYISITDNCLNTVPITFGTAPGATDCFDSGLDLSAPPPPPAGAFDGRFISCSEAFFTDIRGSNSNGEIVWDVHYQPAQNCGPINLLWDPGQLPDSGYFHLVDPFLGTMVNVNMRATNNFTDEIGIGHLQIKYNFEFCSNFTITAGWNMLSLPLEVVNSNYLTLFPDAENGSMYRYSDGYISSDTFSNGIGYWIKFPSAQFEEVCGSDITESNINLNSGWNMIGGPNCNVPIDEVEDPGGIIIPGTLYRYSDGYVSSTSIDATRAYWLKTNGAGAINVNCGNILAKKGNNILPSKIFSVFSKIEISDAKKNNQTLYFNGKLNDNISLESFSLPPLPPAGSFDARLRGDYRLSESDQAEIYIQGAEYPVSISITNWNSNEEYFLNEIIDGVETGSYLIGNGKKILITNPDVSVLKIKKKESLPSSYSLEQNYPNPFNPGTFIEFSLPEDAINVKLSIYNSLGEKVAELVNTSLTAGVHRYPWNAGSSASGMYIYELRAESSSGGFVSMKKMILVK